jgi:hypothetical protein
VWKNILRTVLEELGVFEIKRKVTLGVYTFEMEFHIMSKKGVLSTLFVELIVAQVRSVPFHDVVHSNQNGQTLYKLPQIPLRRITRGRIPSYGWRSPGT